MGNRGEGTVRRTLRIGVIAGLIVAASALAGCSASAGDSAEVADARVAPQGDANGVVAAAADAGERSLVITGALYMTVEDPLAAADKASDIVKRAGGRIDARNEIAASDNGGGSASLTLRIPADHLDAAIDDLGKLGTVDHYETQAADVTTEVTDLEAKISTLRASTDRIQKLLDDAKGISDIITLEDELSSRQATLQGLEAQQRGLEDQVSMSTIDLSLTTKPIVIEDVDTSPHSFWDGLTSGWRGLVSFISVALVVIGVLLPWAILAGLIVAGVMALIRARRARLAKRPPKPRAMAPQFAGATNPTMWATPPGAAAQAPTPHPDAQQAPAPAPEPASETTAADPKPADKPGKPQHPAP